MGLSHVAAAKQAANLAPHVVETKPAEHGNRRGSDTIDRSRTDAIELRGFPLVGRGIAGVIRGTAPGDSTAALERDERELHEAKMRNARGNLKRTRRRDHD
jgi:hypothetical protein